MIIPVVSYDDEKQHQRASEFACHANLKLVRANETRVGLELQFTSRCVTLFDHDLNTGLFVDFISGTLGHRTQYGGGKKQALPRAIGLGKLHQPTVLDVTAGLAKDAFVLATLGCKMQLIEQSTILVTLINDGIERAQKESTLNSIFEDNFSLLNTDAIDYLKNLTDKDKPDVIYMDPMYPTRNKSALVKKDMQILQKLGLDKDDDTALLTLARASARKRVVVKRPKGSATIADQTPTTCIESKKTRYDVYVTF